MFSFYKVLLTDGQGNFVDAKGNLTSNADRARNFRFTLLRDLERKKFRSKFDKEFNFRNYLFLFWNIQVQESMFQPIEELHDEDNQASS